MSDSYIGITGFMNQEEVLEVIRSLSTDMSRKLMAGVLVSNKTLNGDTNKYPNRYPLVTKIDQIFVKHPQIMNMVHYHTSDQKALCTQLVAVMSFGGKDCDGIQLNIAWPKVKDLQTFKKIFPDKKIVLQISKQMMECSPKNLVTRVLDDYSNLVDYILFDASGGLGKELNPESLLPYIEAFKQFFNGPNLVVAGGLCANNLHVLKPLLKIYPNLSVDSEGMLRDENDELSLYKAKNYLHEAVDLLK